MSLPEYVKVRKGGITIEVRRGEAQRYVRLGFMRVEDTPAPEQTQQPEPFVTIHDGNPPVEPAQTDDNPPVEESAGTDEHAEAEPVEAPKRRRSSSRKKEDKA